MSTMTDREMLECAAKAAGIGPVLCYESLRNCLRIGDRKSYALWRPLTDDGDALRLAVTLNLMISLHESKETRCVWWREGVRGEFLEPVDGDPYAATRRAIVRAASEIGLLGHCPTREEL